MEGPQAPHVVILLAVYNGGDFLSDQLQSIAAQGRQSWQLLASDDGSTVALYPTFIPRQRDPEFEFCRFGGLGNGGWRGASRSELCKQAFMKNFRRRPPPLCLNG